MVFRMIIFSFAWFCWLILLIFFFSACKVNGNPGDGTEQGTCPDPSQVCNGAGQCIGTNYDNYQD